MSDTLVSPPRSLSLDVTNHEVNTSGVSSSPSPSNSRRLTQHLQQQQQQMQQPQQKQREGFVSSNSNHNHSQSHHPTPHPSRHRKSSGASALATTTTTAAVLSPRRTGSGGLPPSGPVRISSEGMEKTNNNNTTSPLSPSPPTVTVGSTNSTPSPPHPHTGAMTSPRPKLTLTPSSSATSMNAAAVTTTAATAPPKRVSPTHANTSGPPQHVLPPLPPMSLVHPVPILPHSMSAASIHSRSLSNSNLNSQPVASPHLNFQPRPVSPSLNNFYLQNGTPSGALPANGMVCSCRNEPGAAPCSCSVNNTPLLHASRPLSQSMSMDHGFGNFSLGGGSISRALSTGVSSGGASTTPSNNGAAVVPVGPSPIRTSRPSLSFPVHALQTTHSGSFGGASPSPTASPPVPNLAALNMVLPSSLPTITASSSAGVPLSQAQNVVINIYNQQPLIPNSSPRASPKQQQHMIYPLISPSHGPILARPPSTSSALSSSTTAPNPAILRQNILSPTAPADLTALLQRQPSVSPDYSNSSSNNFSAIPSAATSPPPLSLLNSSASVPIFGNETVVESHVNGVRVAQGGEGDHQGGRTTPPHQGIHVAASAPGSAVKSRRKKSSVQQGNVIVPAEKLSIPSSMSINSSSDPSSPQPGGSVPLTASTYALLRRAIDALKSMFPSSDDITKEDASVRPEGTRWQTRTSIDSGKRSVQVDLSLTPVAGHHSYPSPPPTVVAVNAPPPAHRAVSNPVTTTKHRATVSVSASHHPPHTLPHVHVHDPTSLSASGTAHDDACCSPAVVTDCTSCGKQAPLRLTNASAPPSSPFSSTGASAIGCKCFSAPLFCYCGHNLHAVCTAPRFTINTPHVSHGYRGQMTAKECFFSLFQLHNESANVYSHLLGSMWMGNLWRYSHNDPALQLQSAAGCGLFLTSAIAHTFAPMSEAWNEKLFTLDRCGISATEMAIAVSGTMIHYDKPNQRPVRNAWILFHILTGLYAQKLLLSPTGQRSSRIAVLVTQCISVFVPPILELISTSNEGIRRMLKKYCLLTIACGFVGTGIYASFFPESWIYGAEVSENRRRAREAIAHAKANGLPVPKDLELFLCEKDSCCASKPLRMNSSTLTTTAPAPASSVPASPSSASSSSSSETVAKASAAARFVRWFTNHFLHSHHLMHILVVFCTHFAWLWTQRWKLMKLRYQTEALAKALKTATSI